MPGPVERWLETFMCKQYADTFEAFGYQTLQSVCQLQLPQLLAMGVAREHCENILENVHVLRQTMMGSMKQFSDEMSHGYDNDPHMSPSGMGMPFHPGDSSSRGPVPVNMSMYGPRGSNYSSQSPMMMSQQQAQHQNQNMSAQTQQYNQMYRSPYQGPTSGYQGPSPEMCTREEIGFSSMGPRFQGPNFCHRSQYPVTQIQGSVSANQASMQQAHPHLRRNSGQTPQEVANNILQIASSTYPTHQTVQVPLSKNRPAPYQIPPRSPHYNIPSRQVTETQFQVQTNQPHDYQSSKNFVYPSSSPHMIQQNRMSPVSPSPGMIQSPHSHHSSQSLPNSSPHGSVHSPVPGGIRSPGSDRSSGRSPMLNTPSMASPQRMNYPMTSQQQQGNSPVPLNQQLLVSVSSNSSNNRTYSTYGDHVISPSNVSQLSHHSTHFSPSSNPMNSPGRFSNISSPYTPGSKASHNSPSQSCIVTSTSSQYLSDIVLPVDAGAQDKSSGGSNPLRSLQKLCMLPERQVVDPKSVVNDTCTPSPQAITCPKNFDCDAGLQDTSLGNKRSVCEPASLNVSPRCADGSNCSPKTESPTLNSNKVAGSLKEHSGKDTEDKNCIPNLKNECTKTVDVQDIGKIETGNENANCDSQKADKNYSMISSHMPIDEKMVAEKPSNSDIPTEEVKRQPKKEMLLRAAQDDANKQKQDISSNKDTSDKQVPETDCETQEQKLEQENCSEVNRSTVNKESDAVSSNIIEDKCTEELENSAVNNATLQKCISECDDDSVSEQTAHKDIVNTYNRKEKITSVPWSDPPARVRGQSTGSFSDENSEFDFEDHIGCDDIVNNQISDDSSTEKENIMDLDNTTSVENNVNSCSVNEIKSAIITENGCKVKLPSSPHWKKSKLNDLQALQLDCNQNDSDAICDEHISVCVEEDGIRSTRKAKPCRAKRLRKPVICSMEANGHDSDSDGFCPSNFSEIGLANSDGIVAVSKRTTTRQRKQPLKYKDTSFLQCDFIFDEEEEDEDFDFEPKKKCKKMPNNISEDQGIEMKKLDYNDSKTKNGKIPFKKNGLSKIQQQTKQENSLIVKGSSKRVSDKSDSKAEECLDIQKPNEVLDLDTNIKESIDVTGASIGPEIDKKELCDGDSPKSNDGENTVMKASKPNKTGGDNKVNFNNLAKTEHTGSSTGRSQKQSKSSKETQCVAKQKSHNDSLHKQSSRSTKLTKFGRDTATGDTVDGLVFPKKEQSVSVNTDHIVDIPSSDGKKVKASVNVGKDERSKEYDEVTVDLTYSDDEHANESGLCTPEENFKSVKREKPERQHNAVIKSVKQRTKLKKANQGNRKKNDKRKTKICDNESDYEAGPKNESFKSLSLNKTQDLISKKKKHEKHSFKGPVIHFEGSKEFPQKCAVVNQPFQDSDLKSNKIKTVVQNVSSVEISHLPSDRSVFIPNSETEETDTWVCVLCGKHSSYKFTGDLFGPYTLDVPMEGEKQFSPKHSVASRGNRSRSVDSSASGQSSRLNRNGQRATKDVNMWKEVWVHECCAIWADGVFLIGTKIYGLQEAAKIASKTVCSRCHEHGAMVGCLHKGCQMKYHHFCAMEEDCILDEENFSLLCPKHKSKKLRQPDPSFSSWG